jgi:hypothetical protein
LREDNDSNFVPTLFQRKIGIRYVGRNFPRHPNSRGGYVGYGSHGPYKNINYLLKGFFSPGPISPSRLALVKGHREILAISKGYAVLWAPHLRYKSVSGLAKFVGSVLVNEASEP